MMNTSMRRQKPWKIESRAAAPTAAVRAILKMVHYALVREYVEWVESHAEIEMPGKRSHGPSCERLG